MSELLKKPEHIFDDTLEYILKRIENNENKYIIITGGIGDFLTIEYFFSFSLKYDIIFITKQSNLLKKLMYAYKLPNKYYSLKFDFDLIKKPGFDNSDELLFYFPEFKKIKIVNICDYFEIIKNIIQKNQKININILFFNNKINEIVKKKYNLPDKFILVYPYTEDNRIDCTKCNKIHKQISTCKLTRNFILDDYITILNYCKNKNLSCVIISHIQINIPKEFNICDIINLSDKTSLFESIEISKMSTFYMGIDSFLSVLISKIKNFNNIYIKCNNKHARINKNVYWFPHKNINLYEIIKI
jgi:hypothetical protein